MAGEPSIPPDGISLLGSAIPGAKSRAASMAIVLRISDNDIKSMERAPKSIRFITGGASPMLQFGSQSIDLTISPEKFTRELYQASSTNKLHFHSQISHRATFASQRRSSAKHEEQDEALLALTNSMAAYKEEKKAAQTQLANGFLPIPKNRREAARVQKKGGLLAASRHLQPVSPSSSAQRINGQSRTSAPSGGNSSGRTRAMRNALIHFLAVKDASTEHITSRTHIPENEAKPLLQTMAQPVSGKWRLADKSFREVDVWRFRYATKEDRSMAVENAVRAYDRMRLSKDDKLWQLLLPKDERGTGKVLSRLHLNANASSQQASSTHIKSPMPQLEEQQPSAANTPRVAPASTPKTGAMKKPGGDVMKRLLSKDPKKARAVEEAKEKKRKDRQNQSDADDPRPTKKQALSAPSKKSTNVKSEEFVHSSDEDDVNETTTTTRSEHTKDRLSTNGNGVKDRLSTNNHMRDSKQVKASSQSSTVSKSKPSSPNITTNGGTTTPQVQQSSVASKSRTHISPSKAVTKPTVPSPLGAARPRVTSDVSDRSGISSRKRTHTLDSPRPVGVQSTVRKRHDTVTGVRPTDETRDRIRQQGTEMKMAGSRNPSSTLKDKPVNTASKSQESNRQLSRKSSASVSANNTQSSEERFDGGTSDSSASLIDTITFAQGLDLAQKFKTHYYPQYAKLYDSIADKRYRGEDVDDRDFDKLYEMQDRIEQMKREINAASGRKHNGGNSS